MQYLAKILHFSSDVNPIRQVFAYNNMIQCGHCDKMCNICPKSRDISVLQVDEGDYVALAYLYYQQYRQSEQHGEQYGRHTCHAFLYCVAPA